MRHIYKNCNIVKDLKASYSPILLDLSSGIANIDNDSFLAPACCDYYPRFTFPPICIPSDSIALNSNIESQLV
jgi:hypothetical protein